MATSQDPELADRIFISSEILDAVESESEILCARGTQACSIDHLAEQRHDLPCECF